MTKSNASTQKSALADKEYARLVAVYVDGGADTVKLKASDALIRKVAELWADLEQIKTLPLLVYDKKNPTVQKETAAGKARVKYMAQYVNAMQKLNKEMLGALNNDDDNGLDEWE